MSGFLYFFLWFVLTLAQPSKTTIRPVTEGDLLLLKKVDRKYQKEQGIYLKLKKTVTLAALGKKRQFEGEAWLHQGRMRLEIHQPEPSKIIAGSQFLWVETSPPSTFKDTRVQVLKASLASRRAQSQGLIRILINGGVLKYFRVSGVRDEKDGIIYFLQPNNQSIEFKRAQIWIHIKKEEISRLRYWDQIDNETTFHFSNSKFNQKTDKEKFEYTPPKDAELITY